MAGADEVYVFSDNMLAPDGVTRVSGCKPLDRDLRRDLKSLDPTGALQEWRERRRGQIKEIPPHMKWCSDHDGDGWVDMDDFSPDPRYRDGKAPVCKHCRARQARRMYALMKQAQGQQVRAYNRRDLVMMADGG